MFAFGTPEKQILIEPIFAQWIQSTYDKTSYGFDVLLSSMNGLAFNAGRSIWLPRWFTFNYIDISKGHFGCTRFQVMPDKKDFSYSFPCDGPGQGGTCDILAWDAFYSLAGMAILAHFVLMVIPNYFIQSMVILKGLYEEIERMVSCKKDSGIRKSQCGASLGNSKDPKGFYAENFHEWLVLNLQNQHGWTLVDVDWQCLFGIIACHLWKNHNLFIFQGTSCSHVKLSRRRIVGKGNMSHLTGARQMTHKERSFERSNSALVRRIHQTLSWFKQWSIRHISREENSEADHLVKLVQHRTFDLRLFETSLLEGLA
ncbi:hypothetical protein Golob_000693 [Gossypium lobatum]|uniref:RNase H type-1 domain-containing protein n=1 Tax=Gossypium lobatum TaxID=34289 RepID=A0A7J8N8S6_9ROSI|nr:hypothetical protein [Gossypium lobatum]